MLIDILIFTYIERTEKTIYINATYNEKNMGKLLFLLQLFVEKVPNFGTRF